MKSSFLIVHLIANFVFAQNQYPVDTLLHSPKINFLEKVAILPISGWQRLSYNSSLLSCQFHPSCSNYGGQAISNHGIFHGLAITADRIIRCNPFALDYHYDMNGKFHFPDHRLIDPLQITTTRNATNKSPLLAAGLSIVFPGTGRMYAGRFLDGIMGMWMITISGVAAYSSFKENKTMKGNLFSIMTLIFYTGEIYGAYRTAKYYQNSSYISDLN